MCVCACVRACVPACVCPFVRPDLVCLCRNISGHNLILLNANCYLDEIECHAQ